MRLARPARRTGTTELLVVVRVYRCPCVTEDTGAGVSVVIAMLGVLMMLARRRGRLQGPRGQQSHVVWDNCRQHDMRRCCRVGKGREGTRG
jgi:hypothetical protein